MIDKMQIQNTIRRQLKSGERLMDSSDVARYLKLSRQRVYQLTGFRVIEPWDRTIGGRPLFVESDIKEFAKVRREAGRPGGDKGCRRRYSRE